MSLRTKRYHDLLSTKAQIDALTGLWNRGYLNGQLAIEISVMKREGRSVLLVMADIDHFKPINDTHAEYFDQACTCSWRTSAQGSGKEPLQSGQK